jgi:anaerobic selenocysteine-containing dehydrogenase
LCTKVSRYTERTYHPDRILHPLKRTGPKGSGQFAPVSWDEALNDIANRLSAIATNDPQAILPYSYAGTMGQVQGEAMAMRFFHKLGASLLDRTICSSAGSEALAYTFGAKLGMRWSFLPNRNSSLFGAVMRSVAICIFGASPKKPNATAPN